MKKRIIACGILIKAPSGASYALLCLGDVGVNIGPAHVSKDIVNDTPKEMSILVACHYMPHPNGRWHNTPAPYNLQSNERMMDVLAELKKEHKIIGLFCGETSEGRSAHLQNRCRRL